MTSLAMVLYGYKIEVGSEDSNPETLNNWLKLHGGYVSGDVIVWSAVNALGLKFDNYLMPSSIIS